MPNIAWADLTVPDAEPLRDFYARVTGMTTSAVDMGGYSDFCLHEAGGDPVAGVCHARGGNANLPPVWLIYLTVSDLDDSMRGVQELGGAIVSGPHKMGEDRYCVIKDPAGAYSALYEKK
jgi:uncharacterized protein